MDAAGFRLASGRFFGAICPASDREFPGATDARKKIVWVAPISVDMGIGRQILIHEAVHAAQSCPTGQYELIGWKVNLPRSVDRTIEGILYRNYPHKNSLWNREAFYTEILPGLSGGHRGASTTMRLNLAMREVGTRA